MIPGEYQIQDGDIELNAGRRTISLTVANSGDRPIQVGSHFHFFETNDALAFEREPTRGRSGWPSPRVRLCRAGDGRLVTSG